ncbi:MAG TPA: hypothetical protein VGE07_05630 [Herpetosiphonaceae bacterium]
MRRWMIGLAALAALAWPAGRAAACSGLPPTLELWAESATIAAIGTFKNGTEDAIELEVDEIFTPPPADLALTINNRQRIPTGAGDCGSVPGPGDRFKDGARVLIFLDPDDSGVAAWKVSGLYGEAVYEIIDDRLLAPDAQGQIVEQTSEEARERIRSVLGQPLGESVRRTPLTTTPVLGIDPPPAPPPLAEPPAPPLGGYPPPPDPINAGPPTPAPTPAGAPAAAPKQQASVAGIPLTPLILLLIAVGGFGLSAWGMARQRGEPPPR